MPKKKTTINSWQLTSLSVGLLLLASTFGLVMPQAVKLTESRLSTASDFPAERLPLISQAEAEVAGVQINDQGLLPPQFSAQAVLAQDLETGRLLFEKNIHQQLYPASTTKLMTALVAVAHFKSADILTVPPQALVGGSSMGLVTGESLTFRSLLYGMLLNSGNDAAYTIAFNYPGGLTNFVAKMNEQADQMKLKNSYFTNPAGFDGNYSSAYDLAQIAQAAVNNPQLAKVVATKQTQIVSWDKSKSHALKNLNKLLAVEGVVGIKTGFTENAREHFIGLIERNGQRVLTVVLGSSDRFGETQQLIDWVFANFQWR